VGSQSHFASPDSSGKGISTRPCPNLHVLREHLADESVDLIYLDPPFNSKRDYNLLFKSPVAANVSSLSKKSSQSGLASAATDYSEAQIEAFEDTWHWNQQAEREFDGLTRIRWQAELRLR